MALKSTVYKAELQISDMDRHYYHGHSLTLALHPSETEERMMIRLLAFALNASDTLAFGKGLSTEEDAALWQYRKANKLATIKWQDARKGMMEEVAYFEDKAFKESENMEQKVLALLKEGKKDEAIELINKHTFDFTGATMLRWKELEHEYWGKYGNGK